MSLKQGVTIAAAEAEITRRLHAGERVLLVGAHRTNLPHTLAEHPQVTLWDTDGGGKIRSVPMHARIVLFTKWVGHNQHKWIREDAIKDKQRFVWPELLGTGEIRRLLQPLMTEGDADVLIAATPPPALEATCAQCGQGSVPGIVWGGTVRDFVEKHWSHEVEHTFGWQMREAKRLHRLAAQHGLVTALHYVEKVVSLLNTDRVRDRDEEQLTRDRDRMAREALANERAEQQLRHALDMLPAVPKVEPPVVVVAAPPKPAVVEPRDDMSELLRMIDDASTVLALARETLVRLSRENAEQRGSRERLARIKAALEAVE